MAPDLGFPDRRPMLFGREPDIGSLMSRAAASGLTAVTARPRMGKTWLLEEMARRLAADGGYLCGYHECKGEPDILLRTVQDLYRRWLSESTYRDQARVVWEQHKDTLIAGAGQALGRVCEALDKVLLEGVSKGVSGIGKLIRQVFDALAAANRDLKTGRLELEPPTYEQAHRLVRLVAEISGRPVVLILDAWEKSPSVQAEHHTLESILSHIVDWPACHLFLGVRHPEHDTPAGADVAYRHSHDLARYGDADVYSLPTMHVASGTPARAALLDYLHRRYDAVRGLGGDRILGMVQGYPGTLEHWERAHSRAELHDAADLARQAEDAQAQRYREFDRLAELDGDLLTLAVRLAVFPRLAQETWRTYREVLLDRLPEATWHALSRGAVLADESFPTYGHDTRHAAALRWFLDNAGYAPTLRAEAEAIILRLAVRVQGVDATALPFGEALIAMRDSLAGLGLSDAAASLCEAAAWLFRVQPAVAGSVLDRGLAAAVRRARGTAPLLTRALVNRGVAKGQAEDTEGALADFTAVVDMADAPADSKAKALVNRGSAKGQAGDTEGELADYTAVVDMADAPADQKAQAFLGRAAVRTEADDRAGAIADCDAVLAMDGIAPELRALARQLRDSLDGGPEAGAGVTP